MKFEMIETLTEHEALGKLPQIVRLKNIPEAEADKKHNKYKSKFKTKHKIFHDSKEIKDATRVLRDTRKPNR